MSNLCSSLVKVYVEPAIYNVKELKYYHLHPCNFDFVNKVYVITECDRVNGHHKLLEIM